MKKFALVLVALVVLVPGLWADTAITLTGSTNFTNGSWSLGFQFTPNTTISVTALGSYFPGGATDVHGVSLWTAGGTLLATTSVSGNGSQGFQYSAIAPLELFTGTNYIVSAATNGDQYADQNATWTTSSFLTYIDHVEVPCGGSTACFPTNHFTSFGDFGANFQFQPVPEPGSMALLGSGLLGLAGVVRRKFNL